MSIVVAAASLTGLLNAQTKEALAAYTPEQFTTSDGYTLGYRMLAPETLEDGRLYPLVLFMHGAGERGSDNALQLVHGSGMFLNPVNRGNYPAYVIFPQCPEDAFWAYSTRPGNYSAGQMSSPDEPTPQIKAVRELIDEFLASAPVDPDRIYVMGISMGAMATYDMLIRYPGLFAAAVPICGVVKPERIKEAPSAKMWIIHGDADDVVPVAGSREAYRRFKEVGADVRYKEFVGCKHNSWDPAFNLPDFLSWIFEQRRNR